MSVLTDLVNLDLSDSTEKIIAEYIWIGGSGMDFRSKARTLPGPVSDPHKLPKWNYDGSSTGQPPGEDSEVILYPQAIFKDPFRRGNNILVMYDASTPAGEPIPANKRYNAAKIFSHPDVVAEVPCYGIEQEEYTLLQKDVTWPIGWPVGGYPGPQGPYYCGVGADKASGRGIVDTHYKACLYAGINISGINGEVMPGQWEFQVGPSVGNSAGDELWVARYILERITEIAGVGLSFDPKPIQGDSNGAGAYTNYSAPQLLPSSTILVLKRPRFDDGDWIEESVVEQRTKVFESYGSIQGFEAHFIMDSGSQANYVSQNLVSQLSLSVEDVRTPYHVRWVNQGSMMLVTKRCLVEFSIGNKYEDKIWCNVVPMDACHVLLGRPWQWDRNVVYRGRENVYELNVDGQPITLFPIRG